MTVVGVRPRLLAGGGGGGSHRPSKFAVAAAATTLVGVGTCILAPGFLLEHSVRLVSAVHPHVAVSIDRAEIGWLARKASLANVRVVDKKTNTVLFESACIRSNSSLLDMLFRGKNEVNVFVEYPRVAAYPVDSKPPLLRTNPFSAECAVDDWMHIFVSEGELLVDSQVEKLLHGRVFVDLSKKGSGVKLESSAPGLSVSGAFEQVRDSLRFVTPLKATAELNQAFLSSFLGTVNPLMSQAVAIGKGRVSLSVRPTNDILSLNAKHPVSMEVDMDAYSMKIRQGALIDDVLKILKLSNDRDIVLHSSPARVLFSVDGGGTRQHVETSIDTVSLILADSRRVDVGVSSRMDGTPADFASGNAEMALAIDIHPRTLRDVMKIRSEKPLRIDVRGSSRRPKVQAKDALVRLGVLLVDSMLST